SGHCAALSHLPDNRRRNVPQRARMKPVLRCLLIAALTLVGAQAGAGAVTAATPVPSRDAGAIRAVIQAQLRAIADDDAVQAFSYASPSIRMQFSDAPSFMTMVREGYPMLIKASETFFSTPHALEEGVIQAVHLRDQDGRPWLAIYQMQQQPDKSWRVNGCVV